MTFGVIAKGSSTIELGKSSFPGSTEIIFNNIEALQSFCRQRLPEIVQLPFLKALNGQIADLLISSTLVAVVPVDLSGLSNYQQTIEQVKSFAKSLDKESARSSQLLLDWAEDAPNIWLTKRSQGSLNSIRQLLKRGLGRPRQVERVETQVITQDDKVFASNGNQEDWDANWSDEGEAVKSPAKAPQKNGKATAEEEEDDMSGWGFDDNDEEPIKDQETVVDQTSKDPKTGPGNDEGEGEAWGWGDDPGSPAHTRSSPIAPVTHSTIRSSKPQKREITLRETYHITSLPEQILDIVVMIIEDANSLSQAK